jgi:hypothetical protein
MLAAKAAGMTCVITKSSYTQVRVCVWGGGYSRESDDTVFGVWW